MVHSINRKARLIALQNIQAPILKETDGIGFFKGLFSDFVNSVKSQVDTNHPILSVLNFVSIAFIATHSPVLAIIFSILGTSFGINFKSIFLTIKSTLFNTLNSNPSSLDDNLIKKTVSDAVDSSIQVSDQEIDQKLSSFSATKEQEQMIKQAAVGAALVHRILPQIGSVFGKGRGGIKALLYWVIKAILVGGGIIGATGAVTKVFTKETTPKTTSDTFDSPLNYSPGQSNQPSSISYQSSGTSSGARNQLFQELTLSSNRDIVKSRDNNAPNDQKMGVEGGYEWRVPGPIEKTLYNWVFQTYLNTNDVFRKYNITPQKLNLAVSQVVNEFSVKTNQDRASLDFRIPREYNNVKDIVDLIISKSIR